jgi:hypothetical protein
MIQNWTKFNESLGEEIISNLNDILLELNDYGFYARVNLSNHTNYRNKRWGKVKSILEIDIRMPIHTHTQRYGSDLIEFRYQDIKETVLRVIDYMKTEGYENVEMMGYRKSLRQPWKVGLGKKVIIDEDTAYYSVGTGIWSTVPDAEQELDKIVWFVIKYYIK